MRFQRFIVFSILLGSFSSSLCFAVSKKRHLEELDAATREVALQHFMQDIDLALVATRSLNASWKNILQAKSPSACLGTIGRAYWKVEFLLQELKEHKGSFRNSGRFDEVSSKLRMCLDYIKPYCREPTQLTVDLHQEDFTTATRKMDELLRDLKDYLEEQFARNKNNS